MIMLLNTFSEHSLPWQTDAKRQFQIGSPFRKDVQRAVELRGWSFFAFVYLKMLLYKRY